MIRIAEKIVRITNENEIPFKICLPYTWFSRLIVPLNSIADIGTIIK
jgi:hypothetical protein